MYVCVPIRLAPCLVGSPNPILDTRHDVKMPFREVVVRLDGDRELVIHRVVGHRRCLAEGRRGVVKAHQGGRKVVADLEDSHPGRSCHEHVLFTAKKMERGWMGGGVGGGRG